MASAAKKNVVNLYYADEEPLENKSSDMREDDPSDESSDKEDDPSDESSDKDLDVIKDCLNDDHIKNNFIDIRIIGAGAFGKVYSVKHRIESKLYALKVVPINMEKVDKNEVEVLASLYHQNIVRYHTCMIIKLREAITNRNLSSASDEIFFKDGNSSACNNNANNGNRSLKSSSTCGNNEEEIIDGCLVIQMELCKKENLRNLIDEKDIFTMEETKRRNIILDIICGVQYIHDQGYMHRDLKPSNVFIGQDNKAKIGDFGFARRNKIPVTDEADGNSPTSKKLSKSIGTSFYVAPEVEKQPSYNYRADLYSLGVMIFELFYEMPWGMERSETLRKIRKRNFEDFIKIENENVRGILESLLNHEPSVRMELKGVIELLS